MHVPLFLVFLTSFLPVTALFIFIVSDVYFFLVRQPWRFVFVFQTRTACHVHHFVWILSKGHAKAHKRKVLPDAKQIAFDTR